jgi:hypothetical protein
VHIAKLKVISFVACLILLFCSNASAGLYLDKVPDKNYEIVSKVYVSLDSNSNYYHYINGRYGFTIDFPSFFSMGYLPGNNDGVFVTINNGNASLNASGSHNHGLSLNDVYINYIGYVKTEFGLEPSYMTKGSDWFVLSWKINGTIHYEKVFVCRDYINSFRLEYLAEDQDTYGSSTLNDTKIIRTMI